MKRTEGQWLVAVIMSVVMTVTMLAAPTAVMAETGAKSAPTIYVNSDGEEIDVSEEDGFIYETVNSDGEDVAKIYGYLGSSKKLVVPEKLGGVNVASFAIDPRWPVLEEEYDQIESISLPVTIQSAHAKFMNFFGGLKKLSIAEGNETYFSDSQGVLYKVYNTVSRSKEDGVIIMEYTRHVKVAAYPRARESKTFVMPDEQDIFYNFYEGCPVESLKISKSCTTWLGAYRFSNLKNLKTLTVDPDNPELYADGNVMFCHYEYEDEDEEDYTGLLYYPASLTASAYSVPDGVTDLESDAFSTNNHLEQLTIPGSVSWISDDALYDDFDEENEPSVRTVIFTAKEVNERYRRFYGLKELYKHLNGELDIRYPEDGVGYDKLIEWLKDNDEEDQERNSWYDDPRMDEYEYPLGAHVMVDGSAEYGKPYTVFSKNADGTYTAAQPDAVGTWYAKLIVDETKGYTGLESEPIEFRIVDPYPYQDENEWLRLPYDIYATVGEDYVVDSLARYGEAAVWYGGENADPDKASDWTQTKPVKPGRYLYKLVIDETPAYTGLFYVSSDDYCWIEIEKATRYIQVTCDDIIVGQKLEPKAAFYEGEEYDDVDLSKVKFTYYDDDEEELAKAPTAPGEYYVKGSYETDKMIVSGSCWFYILTKVRAAEEAIWRVPVPVDITLKDKETVQEATDAYNALSASEKEEIDEDYVERLEKAQARIASLEAKAVLDDKQAGYDAAKDELDAAKAKAEESRKAAEEAAGTPGPEAVAAALKAEDDAKEVLDKADALNKAAEDLEKAAVDYSKAAEKDPVLTKRDRINIRKAGDAAAEYRAQAGAEITDAQKAYEKAEQAYEDADAANACDKHELIKHDKIAVTCTTDGTEAYWECTKCKRLFSDAEGKTTIKKPVVIPAPGHKPVRTAAKPAAPGKAGNTEYWTCGGCGRYFSDEACTKEIAKDSWVIPALDKLPNTMTVKAKKISVKAAKLKKKAVKVKKAKAFNIKKPQGKVSFKLTKKDKKAKNKITVSKAGVVTVKKGLKKGKYTIKVKVTAKGNETYKSGSKTVKVTITVK